MDLIGLLILVLVLCVVYWAVHRLASTFGLSPQIVVVLDILLVILGLVFLLRMFGYGGRLGL